MNGRSRNKTNFYIDLVMFVLMGALIGIGVLIKYVLIPGQQRWALFGQNMELTFLGLDRHQWGTIHLIIGAILVFLLLLHLIFHWNMIKCLFKKCVGPVSWRRGLSIGALVLFFFLAGFPLLVNPKKEAIDRGEGRNVLENMGVDLNDSIRIQLKKPKNIESGEMELNIQRQAKSPRKGRKQRLHIRGDMTLREVANQYDLEVETLKKELGLPGSVLDSDQLGILRKQYDFTMGDVKAIVLEHGRPDK